MMKTQIEIPYKIGYNEEEISKYFVETPFFSKRWSALGFDDNDLRILQIELIKNPKAGKIMKGTGGLRKMRYSFENRGKSGSVRVCYVDFESYSLFYLIDAYSKDEKDNLTKKERNELKVIIKQIEEELRRNSQ